MKLSAISEELIKNKNQRGTEFRTSYFYALCLMLFANESDFESLPNSDGFHSSGDAGFMPNLSSVSVYAIKRRMKSEWFLFSGRVQPVSATAVNLGKHI